jgi:hypothetical protein
MLIGLVAVVVIVVYCGLFYDAGSISDYIVSNDTMIGE